MKGLPLDDEEGSEVIVLFGEENKVLPKRLKKISKSLRIKQREVL
jgi:hypothetical protein